MKQGIPLLIVAGIAFAGGLLLKTPLVSMLDRHDHPTTASDKKQLYTCSMHPQVIQDHPGVCPICHMELTPVRTDGHSEATLTIDPVMVQNMGIRTSPITEGPITQSVRVVGYLAEPEPLHRDINLRVGGWIEKLYANVDGMAIEEGKPLFDLYSPELTVAIDEMIAARKQATSTEVAKTLLDSGRRKLQQYGLTDQQIEEFAARSAAPRSVPILSPITGHLTAKMVYEGAAVKAGDLVLRLANRHRMWVDAQVYEQQYPLITLGEKAAARIDAQPGRLYEGNVVFIHPHVDPATRTAMVRIEIPNADHALRQGMYATVEIASSDNHPLKLVPREAVIDTGTRQIAFVSLGDGKFESRILRLGIGSADRIQVLDGLELGEQVVTSGQFLLDSESRTKEGIAKHLSGGLAANHVSAPATQPLAKSIDVPHTDDIVAAYLTIQQKLGVKQKDETPVDVAPLLKSAELATRHTSDEAKPLANAVVIAAQAMQGKTLEQQRRSFIEVSNAMIALVRSSQPSRKVAGSLFIARCPMAFDDEGASWLQVGESIANPYYAVEMKSCGTIQQRIDLKD